ncbi:hypothetical protein GCM10022415_05080 [Knoellia locipacati]|uniref:DUF1129 domain-containing protein n=1 Tax=Knoellia locipacati TaxID=882824 RepID=A0A512SWZ9_9MICO|nr:hypothetical protein KLO01_05060 [Knoellia locipacati]
MSTSQWHYSRALAEQLRINGVSESKVREIVAQVESHVGSTGEDPVDAFGQPVAYAAQWQPLSPLWWVRRVGVAGVVSVGVFCVVMAVVKGGPWTAAVTIDRSDVVTLATLFVLLAILPWTSELWLSRRRGANLGESHPPSDWPVRIASSAVAILGVTAFAWLSDGSESTILQVTRWHLVVVGLIGMSLMFRAPAHPGDPARPVDAPWAPHRTWRTRLRRLLP